MDAITLLRADHREVDQLFRRYEKGASGSQAEKMVKEMIRLLSIHAAIEEQIFYPAVRQSIEQAGSTVLESLEEHHVVKWVLDELTGMKHDDERFDAKVKVLTDLVRHHVEEEEHQLFPTVRKAMGRKQLTELAARLERAKKAAPTRPHPRTPDTPPANVVAGTAAAGIDRLRSKVSDKVGDRRRAKSRS